MSLGENIYKYRVSKNFSQGDLAEMLDVSRQSVSKWENNSATPDLDKIIKLSEIFGITIDDLVKGTDVSKQVTSAEKVETQPQNILKEPTIIVQNNFFGRKIAGTILLSMAFLIVLLLSVKGSFGGGLILAIPFIVCGTICFVIKQNTGLWCAWAIYFMIDIYLRDLTGTNRRLIFNAYYYASSNTTMTISLLVSWALNLTLIFLVIITVILYKNKPLKINRKKVFLFILGIAALVSIKIFEMILPTTAFYQDNYVRNHVHIHVLIYMITDWIKIIISLTLVVNLVRYLFNKSAKKQIENV